MITLKLLFWSSLLLIVWTYLGYYLALLLASRWSCRKAGKAAFSPEVSLVITAYNEAGNIGRKIENCLALSYPRSKLEIIVVSDGSTDETEAICRSYREKGVLLVVSPERKGKDFSQGKGVAVARGEIIVFTDATTFLKEDAIDEIAANFADETVGCVSGRDWPNSSSPGSSGEGAYVKYEMRLRALESKVNSTVVVSGCFFAIRKKLCDNWHPGLTSDFYLPIISYMNGYRVTMDETAIAYYNVSSNPREEFQRKVRTVVNGLDVLLKFKSVLNPVKYGWFALQMVSHKLIRWLVPFCLILMLVLNAILFGQGDTYRVILIAQVLFYALATLSFPFKKVQEFALFKISLFFVISNISILLAWHKVLSGKSSVIWEPTKR